MKWAVVFLFVAILAINGLCALDGVHSSGTSSGSKESMEDRLTLISKETESREEQTREQSQQNSYDRTESHSLQNSDQDESDTPGSPIVLQRGPNRRTSTIHYPSRDTSETIANNQNESYDSENRNYERQTRDHDRPSSRNGRWINGVWNSVPNNEHLQDEFKYQPTQDFTSGTYQQRPYSDDYRNQNKRISKLYTNTRNDYQGNEPNDDVIEVLIEGLKTNQKSGKDIHKLVSNEYKGESDEDFNEVHAQGINTAQFVSGTGNYGNGIVRHGSRNIEYVPGSGYQGVPYGLLHRGLNTAYLVPGTENQGINLGTYAKEDVAPESEYQGTGSNEDFNGVPNQGFNEAQFISASDSPAENSGFVNVNGYQSSDANENFIVLNQGDNSGKYVNGIFTRGVDDVRYVSDTDSNEYINGVFNRGPYKPLFINANQDMNTEKFVNEARAGTGHENGDLSDVLNRGLNKPRIVSEIVNPGTHSKNHVNRIAGVDNVNYVLGTGFAPHPNEYLNSLRGQARDAVDYSSGTTNPEAISGNYENGILPQEGSTGQYAVVENQDANSKYLSDILSQALRLLKQRTVPTSYGVTPALYHPIPNKRWSVYRPPYHGVRFYDAATGSHMANPSSVAIDDESSVSEGIPEYVIPIKMAPGFNSYPNRPSYYRRSGPGYDFGIDRTAPTTIFGRNTEVFNPGSPIFTGDGNPANNGGNGDGTGVLFDKTLSNTDYVDVPFDSNDEGASRGASVTILDKDKTKQGTRIYRRDGRLKRDGTTTIIDKYLKTRHIDSGNDNDSNVKIDNEALIDKTLQHNDKHGRNIGKLQDSLTEITKAIETYSKDRLINNRKSTVVEETAVVENTNIHNTNEVNKEELIVTKINDSNYVSDGAIKNNESVIIKNATVIKNTDKVAKNIRKEDKIVETVEQNLGKDDEPDVTGNNNNRTNKHDKSVDIDKTTVIKNTGKDGKDETIKTITKTTATNDETIKQSKSIVTDYTTAIKNADTDRKDNSNKDEVVNTVEEGENSDVTSNDKDEIIKQGRLTVIENTTVVKNGNKDQTVRTIINGLKKNSDDNDRVIKDGKSVVTEKAPELKEDLGKDDGADSNDKDNTNKNGTSAVIENTTTINTSSDKVGKYISNKDETVKTIEKSSGKNNESNITGKNNNRTIKQGQSVDTVIAPESKKSLGKDDGLDGNDNGRTIKHTKSDVIEKTNTDEKDNDNKDEPVMNVEKNSEKDKKSQAPDNDNDRNSKTSKSFVIEKTTVINNTDKDGKDNEKQDDTVNTIKKDSVKDEKSDVTNNDNDKIIKDGKSIVTGNPLKDNDKENKPVKTIEKVTVTNDRSDASGNEDDRIAKTSNTVVIEKTTEIKENGKYGKVNRQKDKTIKKALGKDDKSDGYENVETIQGSKFFDSQTDFTTTVIKTTYKDGSGKEIIDESSTDIKNVDEKHLESKDDSNDDEIGEGDKPRVTNKGTLNESIENEESSNRNKSAVIIKIIQTKSDNSEESNEDRNDEFDKSIKDSKPTRNNGRSKDKTVKTTKTAAGTSDSNPLDSDDSKDDKISEDIKPKVTIKGTASKGIDKGESSNEKESSVIDKISQSKKDNIEGSNEDQSYETSTEDYDDYEYDDDSVDSDEVIEDGEFNDDVNNESYENYRITKQYRPKNGFKTDSVENENDGTSKVGKPKKPVRYAGQDEFINDVGPSNEGDDDDDVSDASDNSIKASEFERTNTKTYEKSTRKKYHKTITADSQNYITPKNGDSKEILKKSDEDGSENGDDYSNEEYDDDDDGSSRRLRDGEEDENGSGESLSNDGMKDENTDKTGHSTNDDDKKEEHENGDYRNDDDYASGEPDKDDKSGRNNTKEDKRNIEADISERKGQNNNHRSGSADSRNGGRSKYGNSKESVKKSNKDETRDVQDDETNNYDDYSSEYYDGDDDDGTFGIYNSNTKRNTKVYILESKGPNNDRKASSTDSAPEQIKDYVIIKKAREDVNNDDTKDQSKNGDDSSDGDFDDYNADATGESDKYGSFEMNNIKIDKRNTKVYILEGNRQINGDKTNSADSSNNEISKDEESKIIDKTTGQDDNNRHTNGEKSSNEDSDDNGDDIDDARDTSVKGSRSDDSKYIQSTKTDRVLEQKGQKNDQNIKSRDSKNNEQYKNEKIIIIIKKTGQDENKDSKKDPSEKEDSSTNEEYDGDFQSGDGSNSNVYDDNNNDSDASGKSDKDDKHGENDSIKDDRNAKTEKVTDDQTDKDSKSIVTTKRSVTENSERIKSSYYHQSAIIEKTNQNYRERNNHNEKDFESSNASSSDFDDDEGENDKPIDLNKTSVNSGNNGGKKYKTLPQIDKVFKQSNDSSTYVDNDEHKTNKNNESTVKSKEAATDNTETKESHHKTSTTQKIVKQTRGNGCVYKNCDKQTNKDDKTSKTNGNNNNDDFQSDNKVRSAKLINKQKDTKDNNGPYDTGANANQHKTSTEEDKTADSKNNKDVHVIQLDKDSKYNSIETSNIDKTTYVIKQKNTSSDSNDEDVSEIIVTETANDKTKPFKTRKPNKSKLAKITIIIQDKSKSTDNVGTNDFAGNKDIIDFRSRSEDRHGKHGQGSNDGTANYNSCRRCVRRCFRISPYSFKTRKEEYKKSASGTESLSEDGSLIKEGKAYKKRSNGSAPTELPEDSKYKEKFEDSEDKTGQNGASEDGEKSSSVSFTEGNDAEGNKESKKDS